MNLDDRNTYRQLDSSGMLNLLKTFPSQCSAAWRQTQEFNLPSDYRGIKRVIISGVGGSAIAADLVHSIIEPEGIPVHIYRDYEIPPILDSNSLFIASSHSGNTEETLSALSSTYNTMAREIAITSGGKLAQEAKRHGVPAFIIAEKDYPPRYALGYSFLGMLGLVSRVCSLPLRGDNMQTIFRSLESFNFKMGEDIPSSINPAKALALKAKDKIVVIYGAGITAAVSRRWKTQFNENSKVWSFNEVFPELNHNSIEGYELTSQVNKDFFIIMLKSDLIHPRIQIRYEKTGDLLTKAGIPFEIVAAEGKTPLGQILNLISFGDYASYYLALLNDKDPALVENINYLKNGFLNSCK